MNNKLQNLISRGYQIYTDAADSLKSPFLLAVRLYWGWQLMQSGWGKLHNIAGVTQFFSSLGLPGSAFHGNRYIKPGAIRRRTAGNWPGLASDRARAQRQYADGLRNCGPRGVVVGVFGPRQVLQCRSVYFPDGFAPRLHLRCRLPLRGSSGSLYSFVAAASYPPSGRLRTQGGVINPRDFCEK